VPRCRSAALPRWCCFGRAFALTLADETLFRFRFRFQRPTLPGTPPRPPPPRRTVRTRRTRRRRSCARRGRRTTASAWASFC
jgi:hypothetical protein